MLATPPIPRDVQLSLSFTVNGKAVTVITSPAQRLTRVLREDLGLTGNKSRLRCGRLRRVHRAARRRTGLRMSGSGGAGGRSRNHDRRRPPRSPAMVRLPAEGIFAAWGGAVRRLYAGDAGLGNRIAREKCISLRARGQGRPGWGALPLYRLPEDHPCCT